MRSSLHKSYICARCIAPSLALPARHRAFHSSNRNASSVLNLLEQRGYINQIAGDRDALDKLLSTRKVGFYAGVDPTAPSLHLGHLLPFMLLFWLYHHGHHVVSLVGGATAKVGDPSGRLTARAKTAESTIEGNLERMHTQLGSLWENVLRYGKRHGQEQGNVGTKEVLNNATWLEGLKVLMFLRMMGNGARLGTMLGRDTVRNKMEKGDGMSYAEFTYPLLQAWDWWHMYNEKSVQIQIGGGDQYGNIIAGIDAVKYIAQNHADTSKHTTWLDQEGKLKPDLSPMGITVPLLTTSGGEKFGKSAGNAIWLDPSMTSAFDLYGFLLRSADDDVERYLKLFTFVPLSEITQTMQAHKQDPGKRKAQHLLASEVLELVHGSEVAAKTRKEHETLRAPTLESLSRSLESDDTQAASRDAAQRIKLPRSLVYDTPFARILYHAGLAGTKSEGARVITKGGAYIASAASQSTLSEGGQLAFAPIKKEEKVVEGTLVNDLLILRLGKWKVRVIEVVDDDAFDEAGESAPGWTEYQEGRRR